MHQNWLKTCEKLEKTIKKANAGSNSNAALAGFEKAKFKLSAPSCLICVEEESNYPFKH